MTDEQTDTGGDAGGVSGGASDPNPAADATGGESLEERLEKVGKIVKETTGLDIEEVIKEREKAAAASAGVHAQKTYDPRLQELQTALQAVRDENKMIKRTIREAKIASLPEAVRDAAKKLAEAEDTAEDAQATIAFANQALRVSKARELALDLRERGVKDVSKETFMDLDSPEAMEARANSIRADHAEKALAEALKGVKTPPAASAKPSRATGGSTATGKGGTSPGERPWGAQKGKGLTPENLAAGLKAMEEAGYTGER